MRIIQALDHHLATSDFLETSSLLTPIGFADRVMEDVIGPKIIRIWPTRNANDRQILTVRARNRIYHT
jgi:hypothetical protein